MSRLQLALNVDDLEQSVEFYSRLFGTGPAKRRPGYANFAVDQPPLKLVLIENPGNGGSLNHLGVEVQDTDAVDAEQVRLAGHGLATVDEREGTCCYAKQDKFWVQNTPDGERWEIYTVLADSATFSAASQGEAQGCCTTPAAAGSCC
ncbi:ArsI/CadI family heavy metal resistance metalloenzyme [Arthrobacter ginkgonis]|uniref:ArsI/CadI family heavy metal resistance metalloenzyme n=1 Tax=Arthrobacter ginkgonis TaxID=1630594 RepID=A0ABP7CEC3_9MICC